MPRIPVTIASPAVIAMKSSPPAVAYIPTMLADNAAVADIVATTTTRDVPKTAYSTSAGIAAYRPTTGGTPAIVA